MEVWVVLNVLNCFLAFTNVTPEQHENNSKKMDLECIVIIDTIIIFILLNLNKMNLQTKLQPKR